MDEENLYAAPQANLEKPNRNEIALAGRWTRFWAALLDGFIMLAVAVPILYLLGVYDQIESQTLQASDITISALALVFYAVLNGYLLATSGQTIAKKLLSIQVVDYNTNQLLPFWKVFGVRYMPMYIISQLPAVGQIIALIDSLFIFSKDNRCLHDLLANTKVIKV